LKFILDENIPKAALALLAEYGHQAKDIRDTEWVGQDDSVILDFAIREQAMVITTDRDFFHTLQFTHPHHWGIVVILLRQPSRKAILAKLKWFLFNVPPEKWAHRAFQLRDQSWIVSPPIE
jgi:predicted nuclease of predicted toxin-antitoxin system